jgi:hypothetical protein
MTRTPAAKKATSKLCGAALLLFVGSFLAIIVPKAASASTGSDGPTWTELSPTEVPGTAGSPSMAFDSSTDQLIMYENEGTYSWDGSSWTLVTSSGPPVTGHGQIVYDFATDQLLYFDQTYGYTYSWNGSSWLELTPSDTPPVRYGAALGYDEATDQLLLFGGFGLNQGEQLNDTWNWNGTNWVELSPTDSPSARIYTSLAYDNATGQLLLYGSNCSCQEDTWNWNGSNWEELSGLGGPPGYATPSMSYDPDTSTIVLFGGENFSGSQDSTWSWNGGEWIDVSPSESPNERYGDAVVYDPDTSQFLMFGGYATVYQTASNDTWTYIAPVANAPVITSPNSIIFVKGRSGTFTPTAAGSPTPTFSEAGKLPPDIAFVNGTLSGTATKIGTYAVTLTASNGVQPNATQSFTLTVIGLHVTTTSLPNGARGSPYKAALLATDGVNPYEWSATGLLPRGLNLSKRGVLYGTPSTELAAGTYPIAVKVKDSSKPAQAAIATLELTLK